MRAPVDLAIWKIEGSNSDGDRPQQAARSEWRANWRTKFSRQCERVKMALPETKQQSRSLQK